MGRITVKEPHHASISWLLLLIACGLLSECNVSLGITLHGWLLVDG